eukprot:2906143-Prymnesium_polylepis.2
MGALYRLGFESFAGINISRDVDPRVWNSIAARSNSSRFDSMQYQVQVTMFDPVHGEFEAFDAGGPLNDCSEFDEEEEFLNRRQWPRGPGAYIEFNSASTASVPVPTGPKNLTCEQAIDLLFTLGAGVVNLSFVANLIDERTTRFMSATIEAFHSP